MLLQNTIEQIRKPDMDAVLRAQKRWDSIAKPLHSLGKMETLITQIAGITGSTNIDLSKRALVVMCADNGVVAEGISQSTQEITAVCTEQFVKGCTTACRMCAELGVEVVPVDIGVAVDTSARSDLKVMKGTMNMAHGPAMTREQAIKAIEAGIRVAGELAEQGVKILATGEMGIGNTTTSSAVASVLLEQPVELMTGKGAGLTGEGLQRKIRIIRQAIEVNQPDPQDPIDVLAKVGGLDIAGMAGVFLGGAAHHIPVLIDGFISCVAALIAERICPDVNQYAIATHVSREPAARLILESMKKEAVLHADMCLGEGTGAITFLSFLDMGAAIFKKMSTFDDYSMEAYEELK